MREKVAVVLPVVEMVPKGPLNVITFPAIDTI